MAYELLRQGCHDGYIKRKVSEEFGCSTRTVERYLKAARQMYQTELGRPVEELRADAYAFYHGVVTNAGESTGDRIKARRALDDLLGLNAPHRYKHDVSVTTAQAPFDPSRLTDEELEQLETLYRKGLVAAPDPSQLPENRPAAMLKEVES